MTLFHSRDGGRHDRRAHPGRPVAVALVGAGRGAGIIAAPAPPRRSRDLPPARMMHGHRHGAPRDHDVAPQAQRFFDQGLNLLHAFWDTEAYRAFREAARLDPGRGDAAVGALHGAGAERPGDGAGARRGLGQRPSSSRRARPRTSSYYLRAIAAQADPAKGRAAYIAEMEALIDRFPSDVEAQLLLANTLSTPASSYAPDGRPRDGKLYGQAILRNLLRTHPGHAAVHHYFIHAVENGPRPAGRARERSRADTPGPGLGPHASHARAPLLPARPLR